MIIAGLAAVASGGGLVIKGLYRDSAPIKIAWLGNDLVTFFVVVPLLLASLFYAQRGSERAQLVWMGLLGYMVYNYAFYLFGASFNLFFLLYVALFSLSICALVQGLASLNARRISKEFTRQTPVRGISVFLLFISIPLGIVEISQCLQFVLHGEVPEVPPLIFALDLSVVVPGTALAAVLLWRRRPWGYVLAAIMLVKAFTYGLVLSVATALVAGFRLGGAWDPLMPFYVFVASGGLMGILLLLRNLKPLPNYS